ncbi:amino acid permease [Streptomyces rectiverticillatus]|uniref:amino acid permease n=1 Tax=Streptomyces rectiverticillatus TaxID=173860 RepID=UPI0015C2E6F3|nr:amino acid permease [Streptomyces rectiverticillatus]QLE75488.1 amino acid permease [Streptomyces rectiverticillatus]
MLAPPPASAGTRKSPPAPAAATEAGAGLPRGLKQRHLSMIALGGAIGAGLFVGSGVGIRAAGPAIVVAYVLAGGLVLLVMRMLAEMSAADPATGSFSVHAAKALGPWAGLTAGWLYWSLLVVSVAAEALGAADIMTGLLPGVPGWLWMTLFMAVFTGSNLAAVRRFGDLEFWFAGLKVTAICVFLLLGALAVCGLLPGSAAPGAAHLTGHGGFLPHGWHGLALGLVAAVFAYGGLETVTIAAAESADPVRAVGRAARTVVWRICFFYIGSMAVIVTLLPWDSSTAHTSPYSGTLERMGVPGAGHLMNAVVLVALLSAMNANIYGSSRMLYSLVHRGDAPRALGRVTQGGVPRNAVLASAAFGFAAVVLSVIWPGTVFRFLLNAVGATILIVWFLIGLSQLRLRRRRAARGEAGPPVRMWLFPHLTRLALLAIGAVLVVMVLEPDSRTQVLCTGAWAALLIVCGLVNGRRGRARRAAHAGARHRAG